jgi:pimeloyl-ACP methyl ester carboxylesterase
MSTRSEPSSVPVTFAAGPAQLFGILEPAEDASLAALVLSGGVDNIGPGRKPFHVRLARRLAAEGVTALRIDYGGTGESSGGVTHLDVREPVIADVTAAARELGERGYDQLVVVGFCYGARTALKAVEELSELSAAVLLMTPVRARTGVLLSKQASKWTFRKGLRRAAHLSTWRSLRSREQRRRKLRLAGAVLRNRSARLRARLARSEDQAHPRPDRAFVDGLTRLAQRRIPVLLLYGDRDPALADFEAFRDEWLRDLLHPGGAMVDVRVLHGTLEGLRDQAMMDATIEAVAGWVAGLSSGEPAAVALDS